MKATFHRPLILTTLFLAASMSASDAEKLAVSIVAPVSGSEVHAYIDVAGTVSNSDVDVVVVVHPAILESYWVQKPATVSTNGQWKVSQIPIGDGDRGIGEKFEVRAFVLPENEKLHTGQVLDRWPRSIARSEVVEVTRTK